MELRRLHLAARQKEPFAHLEHHTEIKQMPNLGKVIRMALAADMNTRAYRNAREFLTAWEKAKGEGNGDPLAGPYPWETVRRLTQEARQCFAVGDNERGEILLCQAMEINRDSRRVPDPMVVGEVYLLTVERLLKGGQVEKAERVASEGLQRKPCRSTYEAVARYYEALGSNAALPLRFLQMARECPDEECRGQE